MYADRDFLAIFPFSMTAGDRAMALAEPFCVVLSKSLSEKLFGADNPLGQVITYEQGRELRVTGVMEDLPGNSHLRCDCLISFLTMYSLRDDIDTALAILNYTSYIQLREGVSSRDFEEKLPAVVTKYHDENSKDRRYFLTPLRDIHFATQVNSPGAPPVDKKSLFLLMSIAALILIIACVNHVNLATAGAAVANTVPLSRTEANNIRVETETGEMVDLPMVTTYFIDEDYVGLMGMALTAGRNFSRDMAAGIDRQVILNETAARMAGLKNPVSQRIVEWEQEIRIIGVVKDFHYTSFKTRIEPLMFSYDPGRSRVFLIKISGREIGPTLDFIGSIFRRFSPNFAFDHAFLDDLYDGLYRNEGNLGRIILGFSILSLLIAAALFVALPAATYFTQEWLNGFVYRIGLSAGLFVFSAALVAAAAFLTVAGQTIRAARAHPAESLRRE